MSVMDVLRHWIKPPTPMTREQAIDLVRTDPAAYFQHRESSYPWPPTSERTIFLPSLVLRIDRFTLGYIERCTVYMDTHEARICHVATASDFTHLGLGTLLVRAFIAELQHRYGVVSALFEEDSSRYGKAHYPQFFASLGATEIYHPGWRSSWRLHI